MPDARLEKARGSLPNGYQFGVTVQPSHVHQWFYLSPWDDWRCACGAHVLALSDEGRAIAAAGHAHAAKW